MGRSTKNKRQRERRRRRITMAVYYNTYPCSDDEDGKDDTGMSFEEEQAIAERTYHWRLDYFQDISRYYPSFDLHPPPDSMVKTLTRPPYMFNRSNPLRLFTGLLQHNSLCLLKKYLYEEKGFWTRADIRSTVTYTEIHNLQDRVEFSDLKLCDFDFLFYYAFKWNTHQLNYRKNDSVKSLLYVDSYIVSRLIAYLQKDKSLNFNLVLRRNKKNIFRALKQSAMEEFAQQNE